MTKEIYVTADQANYISSSYDEIPEVYFENINQYIISAAAEGKFTTLVPALDNYVGFFAEYLNRMGYSTYPITYGDKGEQVGLRINWGYYS